MTNTIACVEEADVILITGSNTTENHPVISAGVKRAVASGRTRLIVIDPRRIKIAEFADVYLRPNLGTDVAWINGMLHVIIKENIYDASFVEERTEGFTEMKALVEKYTPEHVETITGIPAQQLIEAARLYAGAKVGSILYCMGITQHTSGTDNVKSLANLAMLCGNLGMRGGGVNPLRGQNNVQGACDMGGLPNVFTAYQPVNNDDTSRKMAAAWGVDGLSTSVGMKATEMIPAAHDGRLKALYIIGENPLVSDPDLNHAEDCLEHLELMVVQDLFMTETARLADVVLPSRCFAEKDGTFSNTERRVQRVRKAVDAPGEAWDDWKIVAEIANRMGYPMDYADSEAIFEEIRRVTPSYAGITYQRIAKEGLHWPCLNEEHPGTPVLHSAQFTRGRGLFHAIEWQPPVEKPDQEFPLYLTTGRVLYQYHTGTMTMRSQGLVNRAPESFVEIAPQDAAAYGLENVGRVSISSRRGTIEARVKVSRKAVAGTVFIPFHFAQGAANKLTNAALDPISGIPEYKVCAVKVSPAP
jgi:formate dehydrogenase major subunit